MFERIKKFLHDKLDWGFPNESRGFDGCSFTSTCRLCGGRLLQDSQGNWFHATWEKKK